MGSVTIANGAATSTALFLDRRSAVSIWFPTMTSASATLQGSMDGTNYKTLGDQDGAFTLKSPSGRAIMLNPMWTVGVKYLKVVAVGNEGAERTIEIVTENYTP